MNKNEGPVRKKESDKQTLREGHGNRALVLRSGCRVGKEGGEKGRRGSSLSKEVL